MATATVFRSKIPVGPLVDEDGNPSKAFANFLQDVEKTADNAPSSDSFTSQIAAKSDIKRAINTTPAASYAFAPTDSGTYIRFTSSAAVTATIPANSSVAIDVGAQIDMVQIGTGKVTIVPGSGVTLNSLANNRSLSGKGAGATLIKAGTDEWDLVGSLAL